MWQFAVGEMIMSSSMVNLFNPFNLCTSTPIHPKIITQHHNHMTPLAERMRPKNLDTYIGQQHLVGPTAPLRKALDQGRIPSMILWGPPGVGKTTLAQIMCNSLNIPFYQLSAINSGVKDVRDAIEKAESQSLFKQRGAVLFIDEIHRFSKSQQDALLGAVEKGVVTLIGATTENPSFEVIPALLSRCQVYVLQALEKDELNTIIEQAMTGDESLLAKKVTIKETDALLLFSGGDARRLLNILDLVTDLAAGNPEDQRIVTNALVQEAVQHNAAFYDKGGEQHYDIISAFIKSLRGSDPNASVYWLARMLDGGEDVTFIARRLVILASEDIGLANPNALLMATTTMQAVQMIGMPESRIILSQCVVYLAVSPKSNSSYVAIETALAAARESSRAPVPLHLRNAPTKLMKQLDYGSGYQYAHDFKGNFVQQQFLPDDLKGKLFYTPSANANEEKTRAWLIEAWGDVYGYE
jgi:putative ATPase